MQSIIPLKNVLNSALEWREGIYIDVKHLTIVPNDIAIGVSQKVNARLIQYYRLPLD